jgi:hypothetical protein
MNELSALVTGVVISLTLSSATVFAIQRPLQRLLEAVCPLQFTAVFWTRTAVTLLYLLPLWVVLMFGLPGPNQLEYTSFSEIARRSLAAGCFALVAILFLTGLRLSSVRPPSAYDYPPPVR